MNRFALFLGCAGLVQPGPALEASPEAEQVVARGADAEDVHEPQALARILDALREVETGGQPARGRGAIGDGGRALGPFQIHRAYFEDAGVGGAYARCAEEEFSREVVRAYWRRWCPEALARRDAEVLARIHNGGPRGADKPETLAYWRKVERKLASESERKLASGSERKLAPDPVRRSATD